VTSHKRNVSVALRQCAILELDPFDLSAGSSMRGGAGDEKFVFVISVHKFCIRFLFLHSQCALPKSSVRVERTIEGHIISDNCFESLPIGSLNV
jgi:hypothetical protein